MRLTEDTYSVMPHRIQNRKHDSSKIGKMKPRISAPADKTRRRYDWSLNSYVRDCVSFYAWGRLILCYCYRIKLYVYIYIYALHVEKFIRVCICSFVRCFVVLVVYVLLSYVFVRSVCSFVYAFCVFLCFIRSFVSGSFVCSLFVC